MTELLPDKLMARRLGVPVKWLKAEAAAGNLPALDAGGTFLFDPEAVNQALAPRARETTPTRPPAATEGEQHD